VVVLALSPLRKRGEDVLLLAARLLQQYTAAHGVPPKCLSAEAELWLQGYAWPGNVRELIHMMERVTLLHLDTEFDAETLAKLCLPLAAPEPLAGVAPLPVAPAFAGALPPEAEEIRQPLVQTGGNVARAARLLGVSRDTVRYRMQRDGIARPQPELTSLPAPLHAPQAGLLDSPLRDGQEGQVPAEPADVPTSSMATCWASMCSTLRSSRASSSRLNCRLSMR
jgi:Bacterial regulatory protein, Fis family